MTVPAQANPAVYLCCRAALLEYTQAKRDGDSTARAHERMARTFRLAMPPLIGDRKVRDFIACATHGMLLGLLKPQEATKLLYAAQVAHTARLIRKAGEKEEAGKQKSAKNAVSKRKKQVSIHPKPPQAPAESII